MRAPLSVVLCALTVMGWAVPASGAAPFTKYGSTAPGQTTPASPRIARFRIDEQRGLLVSMWLNGTGPYFFVLDTGAGLNLISDRLIGSARLSVRSVTPTILGGLSTARTSSSREATISRLAIGDSSNFLPSNRTAIVVSNLPLDIDGILDPTEAYSPFGYSIDMVNKTIEVASNNGRTLNQSLRGEGAIVPWVRSDGSNRPFVRLGDGRLALIDTGSAFGLAVNERRAVIVGRPGERAGQITRDIAGGAIRSRRVSPTTISIGGLILRRIPTDILFGVEENAPLILGRDALYPFKITFNAEKREIEFVTSSEAG